MSGNCEDLNYKIQQGDRLAVPDIQGRKIAHNAFCAPVISGKGGLSRDHLRAILHPALGPPTDLEWLYEGNSFRGWFFQHADDRHSHAGFDSSPSPVELDVGRLYT